jgi:hypothetical protein
MRGYFGLGQLSAAEKSDILNQHKSLYNGYQTMQPQVSNTQPLTVYDFAGDKEGMVVNNKGEVKKYTNMGINEQVDTKEVCDECGSMIMDGVCECNYGHMEEDDSNEPSFVDKARDFVLSNPEILMALEQNDEDAPEMCECGGEMYEGVCNECGSGYMEEETGHLDDIYHEEDLDPTAGFDYIEGPSNDVDTFERAHKKLYEDDDFEDYESSYTQDGVDDTDNEDDGFEDINSSEVTDEIEEQGGNADDMDVSDVESAYDFESNGPIDGYPVNELEEDDMYGYDPEKMYEYETMESAWADEEVEEEEMDEQDVSGVQGVYGDMEKPYDFDSNGPGIAGPYQHSSWGGGSKHSPKREEEFEEVDEDLKESFLTQKNKITEMFNRMNRFN